MGIFGWSLPPGAAGDPNAPWNQDGSIEITQHLTGVPQNIAVFWLEGGALIVRTYGEYGAEGEVNVGDFDWRDELSDEQNEQQAAFAAYHRYLERTHHE